MAAVEVVSNQNVVERVSNLPLVSSTYGLVSSVYCTTKDRHPYLRSVCEVAEQGVQTFTSVARTSALLIICKLEPQLAIANDLACKGLDRIEKRLPILQQPSDQIVGHAADVVSSARGVVLVTVAGAKETALTVSGSLSGVVVKTRGAVRDGVETTRAAVSGSVGTVLESRLVRLVSSGVEAALSTSETLVDRYLPLGKDELELEDELMEPSEQRQPSYYVRLGSLSAKLRKRAYSRALAKVRDAMQQSQEAISQLHYAIDLIEYARKNIDAANQKVYNKLNSLVEGKPSGSNQEDNDNKAEAIESRTLALTHSLTQQLQTTCSVLASGIQGLPSHIQQEALSLSHSASRVYASFSKASAFGDLPDGVLASSRVRLGQMKESMDEVMDYLVNNTPLNWLVGPFYPRLAAAPAALDSSASPPHPEPHQKEPSRAETLASQAHLFFH